MMALLRIDIGRVSGTRRNNVIVPRRCLSRRRLLAGMYNAEGDRVNCNVPTRAFPKFAYDQRKARWQ
jgi:hypothetical protein